MRTLKLATSGKHQCDNCSKIFTAKALLDIQDLSERIDEGGVVPSGECPSCGSLCYPVPSTTNVCLIRNTGIELEVVAGPYTGSKRRLSDWLQRSLIRLSKDEGRDDTYHVLHLDDLSINAFCGGYMENIRWVAAGCQAPRPETWNKEEFALLNKNALIKQAGRTSK